MGKPFNFMMFLEGGTVISGESCRKADFSSSKEELCHNSDSTVDSRTLGEGLGKYSGREP